MIDPEGTYTGLFAKPWEYIEKDHIPNPNNYIYFCGLMSGLLIQILIIYDAVTTFVQLTQSFHNLPKPYIFFLKKFKIESAIPLSNAIDIHWNIAAPLFFFESFLCLIDFYYSNFSLLEISLEVWFIAMVGVYINICVLFPIWYDMGDIDVTDKIIADQLILLDRDIEILIPRWRHNLKEELKEDYTESILEEKLKKHYEKKKKL